MYKTAYGDTTSPNVAVPVPIIRFREFLGDTQRIGRGVIVNVGDWQAQLEINKTEYAREFVATPRFLAAYPVTMTPAQFVQKLDQMAGGVLSDTERDQLIAELTAASDIAQARASGTRKVAEDADLRQHESNRAFVLMQYYGYLDEIQTIRRTQISEVGNSGLTSSISSTEIRQRRYGELLPRLGRVSTEV